MVSFSSVVCDDPLFCICGASYAIAIMSQHVALRASSLFEIVYIDFIYKSVVQYSFHYGTAICAESLIDCGKLALTCARACPCYKWVLVVVLLAGCCWWLHFLAATCGCLLFANNGLWLVVQQCSCAGCQAADPAQGPSL